MKSESVKELATALAKVKFGEIAKSKSVKVMTKSGSSYNFDYAPMEAIMSAIRKPLAEQGLSLSQSVEPLDPPLVGYKVETLLMHSSGEWKTANTPVILAQKFDKDGKELAATAQEVGSAISYARRYGVTLACCLVADEDDDGNIADGNEVKTVQRPFKSPHKPTDGGMAELSADERTKVRDILNEIKPFLDAGMYGKACTYVDDQKVTNDQKVGLWELMADMAPARNAMKKEWAEREAKSRAMMNDA